MCVLCFWTYVPTSLSQHRANICWGTTANNYYGHPSCIYGSQQMVLFRMTSHNRAQWWLLKQKHQPCWSDCLILRGVIESRHLWKQAASSIMFDVRFSISTFNVRLSILWSVLLFMSSSTEWQQILYIFNSQWDALSGDRNIQLTWAKWSIYSNGVT